MRLEGDELIKNASAIISDSFKGCQVFRVGGDEFAVIITDEALERIEVMNINKQWLKNSK